MKKLIEYTKNGRRISTNHHVAKVLIKKGLAREVLAPGSASPVAAPVATPAAPVTETRMLQAVDAAAPYGYKTDGTPRKRPGRAAATADDTPKPTARKSPAKRAGSKTSAKASKEN